MRIIRRDTYWHVLFTDGRESLCLERMAMDCGYRLCELSRALELSERYVNEMFARDVGLPPKLWLRRERMVVARRMLGAGIPTWEVRDKLGFCAGNGFPRAFRRIYGTLPAEYARRIRESWRDMEPAPTE